MPACRKDQRSFALFLAAVIAIEVVAVVLFMHNEHRQVSLMDHPIQKSKTLPRKNLTALEQAVHDEHLLLNALINRKKTLTQET